jgi:hypothetical protein
MKDLEITKTTDYDKFKRIIGNRSQNRKHIKRLSDSLTEHPELAKVVPVIINENYEIIDGQHRFQALRSLALPVYYYMVSGLTIADVQILNSNTRNWNPLDYAKSFSELGNKNYKIYLQFRKKYGFTHGVLLSLLTGEKRTQSQTIKRYRIGGMVVLQDKDVSVLAEQLFSIFAIYPRAKTRTFAVAFLKVAKHEDYDHKRMLARLALKKIEDTPYANDYVRQLESIYNHDMGEKNRVRFF